MRFQVTTFDSMEDVNMKFVVESWDGTDLNITLKELVEDILSDSINSFKIDRLDD